MEKESQQKYTSTLMALVIEDEAATRRLLRNTLHQMGFRHVQAISDGNGLLRQKEPLGAELILTGMDLGHAQDGVELIRQLYRKRLLLPWAKVIFVTNLHQRVLASLPMLPLKCDVHPKPINMLTLRNQINDAAMSVHYFRRILANMQVQGKKEAFAKVSTTNMAKFSMAQRQDAIWIRVQLLLRVNRPDLAVQLLQKIPEPSLKFQGLMHCQMLCGDDKALETVLEQASQANVLRRKRLYYQMYRMVLDGENREALALLDTLDAPTLSTFEIDLRSQLLLLTQGADEAIDYLMRKLGTSIENIYFRNATTMSLAKVHFLSLFYDPNKRKDAKDIGEAVNALISANSFGGENDDFVRYIPIITPLFQALAGVPASSKNQFVGSLVQLEEDLGEPDIMQSLMLAMTYAYLEMRSQVAEWMKRFERILADLEMSPEYIMYYQIGRSFQETFFATDELADQLCSIAEHLQTEDFPAAAMGHYYRAHMAAPKKAKAVIELYKLMHQANLGSYHDISLQELEKRFANIPMSPEDLDSLKSLGD